MNTNTLHTLEWSESQGFFHRSMGVECFSINARRFTKGDKKNDWVCLGVFQSAAELRAFQDKIIAMREQEGVPIENGLTRMGLTLA